MDKMEFFFVSTAEAQGANAWLSMAGATVCGSVMPNIHTYRSVFSGMAYQTGRADGIVELVHSLEKQNITVLALAYHENEHGYWEEFCKRIAERYERIGLPRNMLVYPEIKKEFLCELYEKYKDQKLPFNMGVVSTEDGFFILEDKNTPFVHVRQGMRDTVDQPEVYERCVYVAGPCTIEGVYVEDGYTIPSLLQKELNRSGFSCKVLNLGAIGVSGKIGIMKAVKEDLKQGDIVVFDLQGIQISGIQVLNLVDVMEETQAPLEWCTDWPIHCNHKMNRIFTKAIYKELLPALSLPAGNRKPVKREADIMKQLYVGRYFSDFEPSEYGTIGSIVMNCNPFTFGHRHLIEYAASRVDYLIIFDIVNNS